MVFSKLEDGIIIEMSKPGVFAWLDGKPVPIPKGLTMGEISDGTSEAPFRRRERGFIFKQLEKGQIHFSPH